MFTGKTAGIIFTLARARILVGFFVLSILLVLQSCAYFASSKRIVVPPAITLEEFNPAGIWLYEDRIVTGEAMLNEKGNGRYPWKRGYFMTETWVGGIWKGTWHQPGNDREGRFELQLSEDLTFAAGRWWYTRIGVDTSPGKPGGKFTMTRISP